MTDTVEVPGAHGRAFPLPRGAALEIVNTHGGQVVDTWALSAADPTEHLSVEHTRRMLGKLFPRQGDVLYSNRRTPMLAIETDTFPGLHDMLVAACDPWVYAHYGCPPGHRSCAGNFREALEALGVAPPPVPNPLNLWMNVPVDAEARMSLEPSVCRPGDRVVLRALIDATVVLSACPMDVIPISGPDLAPRAVHVRTLAAA